MGRVRNAGSSWTVKNSTGRDDNETESRNTAVTIAKNKKRGTKRSLTADNDEDVSRTKAAVRLTKLCRDAKIATLFAMLIGEKVSLVTPKP